MLSNEEQTIKINLDAVKNFRNPRAIKFLRTLIGQYRLEAENQGGFVRSHIHKQANIIERKLDNALS